MSRSPPLIGVSRCFETLLPHESIRLTSEAEIAPARTLAHKLVYRICGIRHM